MGVEEEGVVTIGVDGRPDFAAAAAGNGNLTVIGILAL